MPVIYFSSLIALGRICNPILNRSDKGSHISLVPDLRGRDLSLTSLSGMLAMGFLDALIHFKEVSLCFESVECILCKAFSAYIQMITCCWCFVCLFFFCVFSMDTLYYGNWFLRDKSILHCWGKSPLVMVYNSICRWIWFSGIMLGTLASIFTRIIGMVFFCDDIFVGFWCQGEAGLIKLVGKLCSPILFCGRVCE